MKKLNFHKKAKTNKSKKEKVETKIASKKGVIISSVVAGSAVGIGIAVSLLLINPNLFPPVAPNYAELAINELDDDNTALLRKYNKNKTSADFTNDFKPYEIINIGLTKATELESFKTILSGDIKASIATQVANSTYIKDGDNHFYENISAGFVKVGLRFYQDTTGVDIYNGSDVSATGCTWSESNKSNLSISEYDEIWGKDLSRRTIYIISSKTTLDTSTAEKTADGYKVSLDLNPVLGAARYVKQMVMTSGLDREPIFSKINLTYTLDNELNILNVDMNSEYQVYTFTWVNSYEHLVEKYYYGDYEIPSLAEDCEY